MTETTYPSSIGSTNDGNYMRWRSMISYTRRWQETRLHVRPTVGKSIHRFTPISNISNIGTFSLSLLSMYQLAICYDNHIQLHEADMYTRALILFSTRQRSMFQYNDVHRKERRVHTTVYTYILQAWLIFHFSVCVCVSYVHNLPHFSYAKWCECICIYTYINICVYAIGSVFPVYGCISST